MIASAKRSEYPIEALAVRAFTVPTNDTVESDGTLEWRSTTLVYVEVQAGGMTGMGYTYADAGTRYARDAREEPRSVYAALGGKLGLARIEGALLRMGSP